MLTLLATRRDVFVGTLGQNIFVYEYLETKNNNSHYKYYLKGGV